MCFRSGLIQELSPLNICTHIFYSPKSHWTQSFLDQSGLEKVDVWTTPVWDPMLRLNEKGQRQKFPWDARLCFVTVAFLLSSASVRVTDPSDRWEVNVRFNRFVLEQLILHNKTAASCQFCRSLISRPLHSLPHCNLLTYYPVHKRIKCWLAV